jgi:tripartite-type tricarboxylate transporter receptor subunit TctC
MKRLQSNEPESTTVLLRKILLASLPCLITLGLFGPAQSQDWPQKPVRIVVPYLAGGMNDMLGRIIAEHLSAAFRQPFVVENRPGAGGLTGTAAVAQSKPDGYALMNSALSSHVLAPAVSRNPGFDPVRDFSHVAYVGGPPIVLLAHPSLGVRSLDALIARLKEGKQRLGYVSPGPGKTGHLVMAHWGQQANVNVEHIPYRGAAQGVTDLIAGHVRLGGLGWTTSQPHIRSGAVIPLAISSDRRRPDFPDVPTFRELGYEDLVVTTWIGLSGPAQMPGSIVQRLNEEVTKILDRPDVRRRLEHEAIETAPMTPAVFTRFVETEIAKWGPIAKAAFTN